MGEREPIDTAAMKQCASIKVESSLSKVCDFCLGRRQPMSSGATTSAGKAKKNGGDGLGVLRRSWWLWERLGRGLGLELWG